MHTSRYVQAYGGHVRSSRTRQACALRRAERGGDAVGRAGQQRADESRLRRELHACVQPETSVEDAEDPSRLGAGRGVGSRQVRLVRVSSRLVSSRLVPFESSYTHHAYRAQRSF